MLVNRKYFCTVSIHMHYLKFSGNTITVKLGKLAFFLNHTNTIVLVCICRCYLKALTLHGEI